MQTSFIRHKLYIHRTKIILVLAVVFCMSGTVLGQKRWVRKNNPNYDDRKMSYGFLIGLHTTAYQIRYSDLFVTQAFDTVYAVEPEWSPGFSLGFIVNYRLADQLDLRTTPKFAFYEHSLRYRYTDETQTRRQLVETSMVELPILLKYKSERRGNVRMYMIGGIKPALEASGRKDVESLNESLEVKRANLHLDVGFGFDLYYPLFKFSPEIRFSRGMVNILDNTTNLYGQPLQRINTNTITVYLLFQ